MQRDLRQPIRDHIVNSWLSGDSRGFDDDTDLQETGILDSFSTLDLVSYLGETFDVQVDPSDINTETFRSVSRIADLVAEKLQAKAGR